ncbi:hypothetical protein ACWV16_24965 [Achromobacter xylosoxidans]
MAKSPYLKTIEVLNSAQTASAFLNSFVKIAMESEDMQLRQLLADGIKLIRPVIQNGGGTKKNVLLHRPEWANLRKYCAEQVAKQTPEWQILAERAGWQPPPTK